MPGFFHQAGANHTTTAKRSDLNSLKKIYENQPFKKKKRRSGCGSFRQPLFSSIIDFLCIYLFISLRSFSPCRRIIGSKPTEMAMKLSLRCGRFKVQKLGEEYFTFLTECQVRMVGWNTRTPFWLAGPWFVMLGVGLVVLGVGCELKFDWDVLRIGCLFSCGKSFVLFFEIPW